VPNRSGVTYCRNGRGAVLRKEVAWCTEEAWSGLSRHDGRVSFPQSMPKRIREMVEAEVRNNPRRLVQAIDYLLVTSDSRDERAPAADNGPVVLPQGVRIERLERDLAERLLDGALRLLAYQAEATR
jgi:hypothetical protein